jgi:membrane fusion protein, multidrug efflux system
MPALAFLKISLIQQFAISFLLAGVLAGCDKLGATKPDAQAGAKPAAVNPAIDSKSTGSDSIELAASDLYQVSAGIIEKSLSLTGAMKAINQVIVKSKVVGDIKSIGVREGMAVTKGQIIATIDDSDSQLRLKERQAQVQSAQAQLDQAKRTLENNRQLLQKNFISQSAFDNAQAAFDVAQSNAQATSANLQLSRRAISDAVLIAPISGLVGERFAQAGEKVSPDNRILSIVDLSKMELESLVPAADIAAVKINQSVRLKVEGLTTPFTGTVARINPTTSTGTRSFAVYITIDNRQGLLRSGMFAQGQLVVESKPNSTVIPESAVRDRAGLTYVYVLESEKLAERAIKVGVRDEQQGIGSFSSAAVEILSGVKVGEIIVGSNLGPLRLNVPVKKISPSAGSTIKAAQ